MARSKQSARRLDTPRNRRRSQRVAAVFRGRPPPSHPDNPEVVSDDETQPPPSHAAPPPSHAVAPPLHAVTSPEATVAPPQPTIAATSPLTSDEIPVEIVIPTVTTTIDSSGKISQPNPNLNSTPLSSNKNSPLTPVTNPLNTTTTKTLISDFDLQCDETLTLRPKSILGKFSKPPLHPNNKKFTFDLHTMFNEEVQSPDTGAEVEPLVEHTEAEVESITTKSGMAGTSTVGESNVVHESRGIADELPVDTPAVENDQPIIPAFVPTAGTLNSTLCDDDGHLTSVSDDEVPVVKNIDAPYLSLHFDRDMVVYDPEANRQFAIVPVRAPAEQTSYTEPGNRPDSEHGNDSVEVGNSVVDQPVIRTVRESHSGTICLSMTPSHNLG